MRQNLFRFLLISCCTLSAAAPGTLRATECDIPTSETPNNLGEDRFDIPGKHCHKVAQNIEASGPPHFDGSAEPQYCTDAKGIITKARVNLVGSVHTPRWTEEGQTDAKYKPAARAYIAFIAAHEERHKAIFLKYFTGVHTKLIGKTTAQAESILSKLRCAEAREHYALDKKEGKSIGHWDAGRDICTYTTEARERPEYLQGC